MYNELLTSGFFYTPSGRELRFSSQLIGYQRIQDDPVGLLADDVRNSALCYRELASARIGELRRVRLPDSEPDSSSGTFVFPIQFPGGGVGHGLAVYQLAMF